MENTKAHLLPKHLATIFFLLPLMRFVSEFPSPADVYCYTGGGITSTNGSTLSLQNICVGQGSCFLGRLLENNVQQLGFFLKFFTYFSTRRYWSEMPEKHIFYTRSSIFVNFLSFLFYLLFSLIKNCVPFFAMEFGKLYSIIWQISK